jgi:hypothetical protein
VKVEDMVGGRERPVNTDAKLIKQQGWYSFYESTITAAGVCRFLLLELYYRYLSLCKFSFYIPFVKRIKYSLKYYIYGTSMMLQNPDSVLTSRFRSHCE